MEKCTHTECLASLLPVQDALDAIHGKWKLLILISVMAGNKRFKEIERSIPKITAKVLAKELRDLEEHKLIKREVFDDYPVSIEYTPTEHSRSIKKVITTLRDWGILHRQVVIGKRKLVKVEG